MTLDARRGRSLPWGADRTTAGFCGKPVPEPNESQNLNLVVVSRTVRRRSRTFNR
jgi:hypothetical protein